MIEGLSASGLLQLGIAAGFVVAFLFAVRVLERVVTAWKEGQFVSRKVFDAVLEDNAALREELARNTKAYRSVSRALNRIASVLEKQT